MRPDLNNPRHPFGGDRLVRLRLPGLCAGVAALVTLAAPALAAAAVRIANVDASGQPSVRLTVVTSEPTTRAPQLTEDGQPVADLTAANLGHAKNVVLAVDRSQSMRGQALRDATEAAIRFIALKPSDDQIEVVTFSSDPLFPTPFTSDPSEAESALRAITDDPKYGTTLYDAIVRSAKSLASAGAPGRVMCRGGLHGMARWSRRQALWPHRPDTTAAKALLVGQSAALAERIGKSSPRYRQLLHGGGAAAADPSADPVRHSPAL